MLLGLLIAGHCLAHEGESHRESDSASLSAAELAKGNRGRPHRLPGGMLYVSKAMQRLLDVRTETWQGAAPTVIELLAEVQMQPTAAATIVAPEPGRLASADGDWPLPGKHVQAGDVLAWLRPLAPQRDTARRRAQMADIDQKLVIARLNADRLKLQLAVNENDQSASGNIYYEQAVAERDALTQQRDLFAASLVDKVALRARISGQLFAVPARAGDGAVSGQVLFQLADPSQIRLVALTYDPQLGERVRSARISVGVAGQFENLALSFRGHEPLADLSGWRLLFDVNERSSNLNPGQIVPIQIQTTDAYAAFPTAACAIRSDGTAQVWLHRSAERFEAVRLASCPGQGQRPTGRIPLQLAAGDRLVVRGAALLAQYP